MVLKTNGVLLQTTHRRWWSVSAATDGSYTITWWTGIWGRHLWCDDRRKYFPLPSLFLDADISYTRRKGKLAESCRRKKWSHRLFSAMMADTSRGHDLDSIFSNIRIIIYDHLMCPSKVALTGFTIHSQGSCSQSHSTGIGDILRLFVVGLRDNRKHACFYKQVSILYKLCRYVDVPNPTTHVFPMYSLFLWEKR